MGGKGQFSTLKITPARKCASSVRKLSTCYTYLLQSTVDVTQCYVSKGNTLTIISFDLARRALGFGNNQELGKYGARKFLCLPPNRHPEIKFELHPASVGKCNCSLKDLARRCIIATGD